MSKIKTALVVALLGSSTAAMAAPSVSFSANAQVSIGASVSGPTVRDHRTAPAPLPAPMPMPSYPMPAYPMPANQWTSWISLGSPLSLSDGRDVLRPSLANMSITQLRLQATTGMSYVQKVQVRFKDGTLQNLNLNKWLTTKAPMLDLNIQANHRGIDSITVLGTAQARNATYQVFAQGSRVAELPPPPPAAYPVLLSGGLDFNGTVGFRNFGVGAEKGQFRTVEIAGTRGTTYIEKVYVRFANGQSQTISNIDATLRAGQKIDLKLDGNGANAISEFVVWTNELYQPITVSTGQFSVYAIR